MPELPEVENVRRSLERSGLIGQRFQAVELLSPKLRHDLDRSISKRLFGDSVIGVRRRAKYLLIETNRYILMSHLGMTGSWRVTNRSFSREKHDHVVLKFESGVWLVFHDPRRFGMLELLEKNNVEQRFGGLGVEPLDGFEGETLFAMTRGSKAPIKTFLMDQKRVVGVGNIYASEALFQAGIKPLRRAGRLTRVESDRLVACVRQVLEKAIQSGGSTIRDYRNSEGKQGSYQAELKVYDREGEPCPTCRKPIRMRRMAGRSTYWCAQCQR